MPKILLTGPPGCGKTTLIRKVIEDLKRPYCGFYTKEIRGSNQRTGFSIQTLSEPGRNGILAQTKSPTPWSVGKYYVNLKEFEELVIPELANGLKSGILIIIDEIGKMEILSAEFRGVVERIFASDNDLLATILFGPHPFCDKIKSLPGVQLMIIERKRSQQSLSELLQWLS